ncbi:MAG: glycosyltransferase [Chloroflexi bacterium]|nr:glycosyltransferase [Chloroflexota bacterium]
MMRVLFVTNRYPSAETPGDSPCIQQQEIALQRLGHDVNVLYIPKGAPKLKYARAMWQVFWSVQVLKRFDLIHAHYGYCGVVAKMQWRSPVVVTFRGSDVYSRSGPKRLLGRLVAKSADAVIVMNDDMQHQLACPGSHIIPYGIDTDLVKPEPQDRARRALGLPLQAPLVLFPYDPARQVKRFDLAQQAVDLLKRELPDVQMLVVYDRPYRDAIRYMNACDALLLTSDSEGAPGAVREALACNLPIVSVDVGDVAQVIGDTDGCYIVARDPEDIAQKLARVLRARQRTNGRHAAQELSIAHSAANVAALYARLSRDGNTRVDPRVSANPH